MNIYFVSDLHIKSEEKEKARKFVHFLQNLPSHTTHLVLLGDIFDMWIGPHDYFIKKFPVIISVVQNLIARGVQVHYFEGNHDLHIKKFWQDKIGATVHDKEFYFNFDGFIVRAEHGDFINKKDRNYQFLRSFLRSVPMKIMIQNAPGRLVHAIGDRSSQMSRLYSERIDLSYKNEIIQLTREYAKKTYRERPFDLIVTGHTHVDDDFVFEEDHKKIRSLNLGSWFDKPKALHLQKKDEDFSSSLEYL